MSHVNLTWLDIKEYLEEKNTAIIVTGSYEQHGPLLPLTTDTVIAEFLAQEIGKRTGIHVLPSISFGCSNLHMAFPGTVSISEHIFKQLIKEMILSLYIHGFANFIVINGHGGNTASLTAISKELLSEYNIKQIKIFEWWQHPQIQELISKHFGSFELHASAVEVSVYYAIKNKLSEPIGESTSNETSEILSIEIPVDEVIKLTPEQFRQGSPHGIIGSWPTDHSVELGELILNIAIETMVEMLG